MPMARKNIDGVTESTTDKGEASGDAGNDVALEILEERKDPESGQGGRGPEEKLIHGMDYDLGNAQPIPPMESVESEGASGRAKRILETAVSLFLGNEHTKRVDKFYSKFEENIYLITEDSETIGAFLFAPKSIDAGTQLFIVCHGKGCDRYHIKCFVDFPSLSADNNVCFLLLDYRGFADSSGEYTIQGVNYDILAAFRYLRETYGARDISLVGHSLGTAAVLEYTKFALTTKNEFAPKRVFVIAPFTTTLEICREFTMYSVIAFFIPNIEQIIKESFNYDSVANAKIAGSRLVVFHGAKDPVVKTSHGKAIAKAAGCPLFITAHNHVNIFADPLVWKSIFKHNAEQCEAFRS